MRWYVIETVLTLGDESTLCMSTLRRLLSLPPALLAPVLLPFNYSITPPRLHPATQLLDPALPFLCLVKVDAMEMFGGRQRTREESDCWNTKRGYSMHTYKLDRVSTRAQKWIKSGGRRPMFRIILVYGEKRFTVTCPGVVDYLGYPKGVRARNKRYIHAGHHKWCCCVHD